MLITCVTEITQSTKTTLFVCLIFFIFVA